jgi:hypothetical protein
MTSVLDYTGGFTTGLPCEGEKGVISEVISSKKY